MRSDERSARGTASEALPTLPLARRLWERPWTVFWLLLAARTVLLPYQGLVHDAELYAVQVLNRATDGFYAEDLFFAYGSQDAYSLFSRVMSGPVRLLGLEAAFQSAFMLGFAVLLLAELRLVRRLVRTPMLGLLASLTVAVVPLAYGGWGVFHVNEPYLTPRIVSTALVLFAVERTLAERYAASAILLVVSASLHPIMTLPGALFLGAAVVTRRYGGTTLMLTAGGALGILLLAFLSPVAGAVFGPIDARWVQIVRQISPHCFPFEWSTTSWIETAIALGLVSLGCQEAGPEARVCFRATLAVGLVSLGAAVLTEWFPHPLPLQAQAYRGLWLVSFAAVPAGVAVGGRWLAASRGSRALVGLIVLSVSTGLVAVPNVLSYGQLTLAFALLSLAVTLAWRASRRAPPAPWSGTGVRRVGLPLVHATAVGTALVAAVAVLGLEWAWTVSPPLRHLSIAARAANQSLALTVGTLAIWAVVRAARPAIWWGAGFAGWILAWVGVSAVQASDRHLDAVAPYRGHQPFVSSVVHRPDRGTPTVYWPTGLRELWLDVRVHVYFHFKQIQGAVFDRRTAFEAARRTERVRPFELARIGRIYPGDEVWGRELRLFGGSVRTVEVRAEQLRHLCADPILDFAVLEAGFPQFGPVTDGRLYVYDCDRLRGRRVDAGGEGSRTIGKRVSQGGR